MQSAEAGKIGARSVVNVAYGAARSGRTEMPSLLFATLARVAERRVSDFNAQDLANTAWASAKTNQPYEKLFSMMRKQRSDGSATSMRRTCPTRHGRLQRRSI